MSDVISATSDRCQREAALRGRAVDSTVPSPAPPAALSPEIPLRQNRHTSSGVGGGSMTGEPRTITWVELTTICNTRPAMRRWSAVSIPSGELASTSSLVRCSPVRLHTNGVAPQGG